MDLTHPAVKAKIETWEEELQDIIGAPVRLSVMVQPVVNQVNNDQLFDRISTIVCHTTEVPFEKVLKKSRKREVVITRQLICYYAKEMTALTLTQIGKKVGGQDHTTVIHACATVRDLLQSKDIAMTQAYNKVSQYLFVPIQKIKHVGSHEPKASN